MQKEAKYDNVLLRMHPVQRVGVSVVLAIMVFFLIRRQEISPLFIANSVWATFSFFYILTSWLVLFTRTVPQIKQTAMKDDGSVMFVFIMVIVSCFASMFTVLLLMTSKDHHDKGHLLYLPVSVGGMLLSWVLVHTMFTFHYAHEYYGNDDGDDTDSDKGLDFPGDAKPDYIDFAYFSFVIGCTFQVSDVEVSSPKIRRIVLVHGLLSFALNTFVVALTINFVGSLMN